MIATTKFSFVLSVRRLAPLLGRWRRWQIEGWLKLQNTFWSTASSLRVLTWVYRWLGTLWLLIFWRIGSTYISSIGDLPDWGGLLSGYLTTVLVSTWYQTFGFPLALVMVFIDVSRCLRSEVNLWAKLRGNDEPSRKFICVTGLLNDERHKGWH